MDLPCLKNARRIFAIVSTTSIPTSASKNHGSQCGPSVPGSRLEADHPEKGVLFACRFTDWRKEQDIIREWRKEQRRERGGLVPGRFQSGGMDTQGRTDPGQFSQDELRDIYNRMISARPITGGEGNAIAGWTPPPPPPPPPPPSADPYATPP